MSHHSVSVYQQDNFRSYLSYIRNYPMLTAEEELRLATDVFENQNVQSAQKLVVSHLKLVAKVAYEMRGYGLVLMDLIGEGSIGLMHAVKKFNPNLGNRFSTYAKWWIKAYIQEYIIKSWSLVKIGTTISQKKLFFHLKKLKHKILLAHDSQSLSNEDCATIAKKLSVSSKEVKEMDLRLSGELSLDKSITDDSSDKMLSQLADSSQDTELSVSQTMQNNLQRNLVDKALDRLTERQAEIIRSRHFQEKPMTLDVLGTRYKISAERVRQIEYESLKKVKQYCLANY